MTDVASLLQAIGSLLWPVVAIVIVALLLPVIRTAFRTRPFTVKVGLRHQIQDLQQRLALLENPLGLQRPQEPESLNPESLGVTPRPARSILWVDDRPKNNAFEIANLEQQGIRIVTVESTAQALSAYGRDAGAYDTVITDMGRPESPTAGLEVISLLRQRGFTGPAVVYTTAKTARQHGGELSRLGAVATASPTELYRYISVNGAP